MRKNKMPKEAEKLLKQLVSKLPVVMYKSHEIGTYTGRELMLAGQDKDGQGQPINPDKLYHFKDPVHIAVNHWRRVRKAWESQGLQGVKEYVDRINAMAAAEGNKITLRAN